MRVPRALRCATSLRVILSAHPSGGGLTAALFKVKRRFIKVGGHLAPDRAPKSAMLIAVVALLLSAGAPSSPATAAGASFSQATTAGGTFTGAWVGPCCVGIANANPLIAGGDQHFLSKIYEPLVTYSVDKTTGGYGPVAAALATDWSTSNDGLTWTFHLQPNVTWQDGSPFTGDDVIFTLTLCESPKVGCVYGGGISNIKGAADVKSGAATTLAGVAAPDPMTVTITTDTPNSAMLDALAVIWIVQQKSPSSIPHDQITKNPYWTTPGMEVAIDRKSILTNLYGGAGQALPCLFGNPAYLAPDTQMYDYSPDKAKDLIAQSGVNISSLPTFTFDTYYNDPLSLNVMTAVQK